MSRKNIKDQFDFGKAFAISWFMRNGYKISIPLSRHLDYDLICDKKGLYRIKVATSSYKNEYQNYVCSLRNMSSNYYGETKVRFFDIKSCDLVFVYCDDDDSYLIPSEVIEVKTKITLSLFKEYKIDNLGKWQSGQMQETVNLPS